MEDSGPKGSEEELASTSEEYGSTPEEETGESWDEDSARGVPLDTGSKEEDIPGNSPAE